MDHLAEHVEGHVMVTVPTPFENELLADPGIQNKKIGPQFAAMRGAHLNALSPVEAIVRKAAPLKANYDVNRAHAPYFGEFTYTEFLGSGLLVSPMSAEVSARLAQMALDRPEQGFDAASAVLAQREERGTLDKYKLDASVAPDVKAVAFLPGTNIFKDMVSQEAMTRAMFEDDDLMLKPHPLSDAGLVHHLCQTFGYNRVIAPNVSGDACLMAAERVYAMTTTELGLYAVLKGKPIRNIGNFWNEGRGAYSAFYRLLWGKSTDEAKAILTHVLNSPFSGFMHKDDPDLESRVTTYFKAAMDIRALMKPLIATPMPAPPEPKPQPSSAPPQQPSQQMPPPVFHRPGPMVRPPFAVPPGKPA